VVLEPAREKEETTFGPSAVEIELRTGTAEDEETCEECQREYVVNYVRMNLQLVLLAGGATGGAGPWSTAGSTRWYATNT
jgi:hypothetical protein